ncbi:MAG TPA: FKBP-type peptidyl-prolyl cis-trans isomerase [Gemmataceae bacterium]|nr:FKBP-type peptidyl-prolyl cis-trans isomerase [Gemmataceae bacterium]
MIRFVKLAAAAAALCGLAVLGPVQTRAQDKPKEAPKVTTTKTGLKYADEKVGTGKEAKPGDNVQVHYTGWLKNGTKFDSSVGKKPLSFRLGTGRVIAGWHEGIEGMKEGGKRKLIIPPDLAYGDEGYPPVIPPKAELTFEVELVKIN